MSSRCFRSFPSHFNEDTLFTGSAKGMKFKNDFKEKFKNISRIMDCVGCDKCRLWGKLQVNISTNKRSMHIYRK